MQADNEIDFEVVETPGGPRLRLQIDDPSFPTDEVLLDAPQADRLLWALEARGFQNAAAALRGLIGQLYLKH